MDANMESEQIIFEIFLTPLAMTLPTPRTRIRGRFVAMVCCFLKAALKLKVISDYYPNLL